MPVDSDSRYYFKLHGISIPEANAIYMHVPCRMLDRNGRCIDYEHRPKICRDYAVGCPACVLTRRLAMEDKT